VIYKTKMYLSDVGCFCALCYVQLCWKVGPVTLPFKNWKELLLEKTSLPNNTYYSFQFFVY